jgi:hypothetical protein
MKRSFRIGGGEKEGFAMKIIMRLVLVPVLALAAAPSYSAGVVQVFTCEMFEEVSEKEIVAAASKWLTAARSMKGGEQMELSIYFPVAAQMDDSDFRIVLKAPSFEAWGAFWDGYDGSPAHKIDAEADHFTECPDSALWEGISIPAE